ncbi:hypothetical protein GCM10007938_37970 [Vibrio zhanjiangensis]|uniref:Uncharacterized protein n=1 Tax=Vibrio zhanjiangensis TaxID=1046128 RepID=A0ABQ6F4X0_9VIBR|nr:hypothetical protein [Vibrio zhanjiangensis]GLT20014.1 hypothetical protein GCM10007938_37970 [Vibrio zhanjiangensis]
MSKFNVFKIRKKRSNLYSIDGLVGFIGKEMFHHAYIDRHDVGLHKGRYSISDKRIKAVNIQDKTVEMVISDIPVSVSINSLLRPSIRKKLKINNEDFIAIYHIMER